MMPEDEVNEDDARMGWPSAVAHIAFYLVVLIMVAMCLGWMPWQGGH